jgi:hypothetical protein
MEDSIRRFRKTTIVVTVLSYLFGSAVLMFVVVGSHGHLPLGNPDVAGALYPVALWVLLVTAMTLVLFTLPKSAARFEEWARYRLALRQIILPALMILYAFVPVIYMMMDEYLMIWFSIIPAVVEIFLLILFLSARKPAVPAGLEL